MAKTFFKNLIKGYETPIYPREDGGEINTGVKFFERSFSGSVTSRKKKILTSGIYRMFARFVTMGSYTGTRGYGSLFLSYGLMTVIYEIAKAYFNLPGDGAALPTVIGVIMAILAIPLMLVDKPFCIALQDFPITEYLFFEFFSIKRMQRHTEVRGIPAFLMAMFGVMLASAGIFFGTMTVLAVLVAVVAIYFSFVAPEFAFFSTVVMLPIFPAFESGKTVLIAMIAAAFLSLMRKVVFGKRVYSVEQYDLVISALMIVILASGIFMRGIESFESSLLILLLSLGYSLASNLITNRRLAESALGAIVISSTFTVAYTVYEIVTLVMQSGPEALLGYSATATFRTNGAYAAFLLMAIFASGYFASTSGRRSLRVRYAIILVLNILALILTGRFDAPVALVAGLLVYKIMRKSRKFAPFSAILVFLPLLLFLFPAEIFDAALATVGANYTKAEYIQLWSASVAMFLKNPFAGVGIGSDSFSSEIAGYGQIVADNSSSFLIELACEAGALALLVFLVLLAVRLYHRTRYRNYIVESHVTHLSFVSAAMMTALIAFGMTEYIWADETLLYLFWCIFGIGSATLRIAKREHDDRVMYYGDLMTADTSVIDVKIG